MTKDELIAKQQLDIEELKEKLTHNAKVKSNLRGMFISIGAPLNDNVLGFNTEQLKWCWEVNDLINNL